MTGVLSDEEVCSFVDQFIHSTPLQTHSHTRSCRIGLQTCRYHFLKPHVPYTLLVTEGDKVANKPNPSTISPSNQTAQHNQPDEDQPVIYKNIFIQVQQDIQQFETNYPDEKLSPRLVM
jgi:hypothetical protein